MPQLFDLTYKPSTAQPTLPTDVYPYVAPAIYRGDPYTIAFTLLDGEDPYEPDGDLVAQLRPARFGANATVGDPLADFEVTVVSNAVTIHLTPEQTMTLPDSMFWDIEEYVGDESVGTWFTGKAKAWGDVTREAS